MPAMDPNLEAIVKKTIVGSPLAKMLGVEEVALEIDRAELRLPFRTEVTTIADVVRGGSQAARVDFAATAAAYSGVDPVKLARGTTIGFTINYLSAGRGQDLIAKAQVIQRGKSIVVIDVAVDGADGKNVSRALVTYKLS